MAKHWKDGQDAREVLKWSTCKTLQITQNFPCICFVFAKVLPPPHMWSRSHPGGSRDTPPASSWSSSPIEEETGKWRFGLLLLLLVHVQLLLALPSFLSALLLLCPLLPLWLLPHFSQCSPPPSFPWQADTFCNRQLCQTMWNFSQTQTISCAHHCHVKSSL